MTPVSTLTWLRGQSKHQESTQVASTFQMML